MIPSLAPGPIASLHPLKGSQAHPGRFRQILTGFVALLAVLLSVGSGWAQTTNGVSLSSTLPDVGASAIRALGALAMVLALFFAGVWLFRNGQRLAWRRNGAPRITILESRPLGNRYVLYLVGCDQQRMLIGSSPAGLTLLSQLPVSTESVSSAALEESDGKSEPFSFARHLQALLSGKAPPTADKPGR